MSLRVVAHPLLADALGRLRDRDTPRAAFRQALDVVSRLLAAEATRDLPVERASRETPVARTEVDTFAAESVTLVPILRAGLGMEAGVLGLLPGAAVGHVGLERDAHTRRPREYYVRLPPDPGGPVFVVDPMIATGGSAAHALDLLRARDVEAGRIRFLAVVAAPEGVSHLVERHPNVAIFTAALDERLNDDKQIVPGIGDAGDRLFGTRPR